MSIVQRGYSDEVVDAARSEGGTGAVILQGKGTNNEKRKFFGFNIEPENELVMMVVEADLAVPITKAIYKAVDYKSEARGLVFVLPVSYVSGMSHSKGFFDQQAMGELKYHFPEENPENDIGEEDMEFIVNESNDLISEIDNKYHNKNDVIKIFLNKFKKNG